MEPTEPIPSGGINVEPTTSPFDAIKHANEFGAEYWSARELQPHLGYGNWRNFTTAIKKARISCEQSGNDPQNHFDARVKMVTVGSDTKRQIEDVFLSRFACYLIAQNGNPQKKEIAAAQKYFLIQARRQELQDAAALDVERVRMRGKVSDEFRALSGAARQAGVENHMFGVFHDAGYKGLYNGLGRDAIKSRKRIPAKDDLLDRMGATELAANQFRMTQAREQLSKSNITNQEEAIRVHARVGGEVRDAIKRIGGTMPEDIAPAEHIKDVKKRIKNAEKRLTLAETDARGLVIKASTDDAANPFDEL